MASDDHLSTEVIIGALSSGQPSQQIHLLVHQGHMHLLVPKELSRAPQVIGEVIAAGWECHLEAASGSKASVRARDYLLCPRCAKPEEVPRRSGLRPPSVLGLHLRPDHGERIGEWTPGILETQDLPTDVWTNAEIAAWLGPQAPVFQKAGPRPGFSRSLRGQITCLIGGSPAWWPRHPIGTGPWSGFLSGSGPVFVPSTCGTGAAQTSLGGPSLHSVLCLDSLGRPSQL